MSEFHLLRPEALLLLIPLVLLMFLKQRKKTLDGEWSKLIHPNLQPYVMQQAVAKGASSHWFVSTPLWVMAFIAVTALSGPTWQKQDSPIYNNRSGLIVALDLSLSMTAQDVTPSRLQWAKYKIVDVFKHSQTSAIALLAYAGDTHIATPLTRDTATIESLLPSLNPYMMPLHGSHLVRMAEQAANLFNQGNSKPRQLLLITDGVETQDINEAARILKENKIELSILAVGSDQGAPLVKPDGSFFSDAQGNVIMPGLEMDNLITLQKATGGKLTRLTNDDSDLTYLLDANLDLNGFEQVDDNLVFDQWHDAGYWLLLIIIPLALFAFRKGVIAVIVVATSPFISEPVEAFEWRDWFRNSDQQGMTYFEDNPQEAAKRFNNSQWQASSEYKAGNYEDAVKKWAEFDDADSHYNRGNALAKMNKLDEAIAAYDRALRKHPDHEDATYNKALLEQLKQQQQNQQNQQNGEQNQDHQQNSQNDGQQQNSQNQDGQSSDAQNQEQGEQQDADQQQAQNQQNGQQGDKDAQQQEDAQSAQQSEEDKLKQQAEQSQSKGQQEQDGTEQTEIASSEQKQANIEKDQALQQWIQRIPDNPGELLENKFRHQYRQRQHKDNNEDRKPW